MPLLDETHVQGLLWQARLHHHCDYCGHFAAFDYCRTCDEFYWLHEPGCLLGSSEHHGHRLTIVPFVEER